MRRKGEADSFLSSPSPTADCHFSHPSNRAVPYSKASKPNGNKYSATFNKPSSSTSSSSNASIGVWPTEQATHVSERLKRFSVKENDDEDEGERIIPGGGESKTNGKAGEDHAKVEIVVEEEKEETADAVKQEAKVEA